MLRTLGSILLYCFIWLPAALTGQGAPLDPETINVASPEIANKDHRAPLIKMQESLDRAGFSPGIIDGRDSVNFSKALAIFQSKNDLDTNGRLDSETFDRLSTVSSAPAVTKYEIADKDVLGPFEKHIQKDFAAMAELPALPYTGSRQKLAARFHMDERLNPRIDFGQSERILWSPMLGPRPPGKVVRIVLDKLDRALSAFDDQGRLIAFYPASIGSREKPAPSGVFKVRGVTLNPTYHYDPKFAFKGVKVNHRLTIKPGPSNPVGAGWIDLSVPSYGIHGTPTPQNISKTESHGCVRLTNWDALDLASRVSRATVVDFKGTESRRRSWPDRH